jgi:putative ABC transport system permease protein
MKLIRNVLLTRRTLFAHKLRTTLALMGITIGVAAVIIMVAVGKGAQSEVLRIIQEMGSNLLVVSAERTRAFGGGRFDTGNVVTLMRSDSEAILEHCPSVALVAPAQHKRLQAKHETAAVQTKVLGTTPEYVEIRNFQVVKGRFFWPEEEKASKRVAVLGAVVAYNLFGTDNPIGEIIRIEKIPFEVVGVLKPKGISPEGANEDDQIMIPLRTALRRVFNQSHINNIYVRAESREAMKTAEIEMRQVMRDRHRLERRNRPDDFTIQNQLTTIEAEQTATESFTLLISAIAAISLFVGGIGILAVMQIAVRERTSEIGLRMAVGARRSDILVQFLAEALVQGLVGGAIGVLLGVTGALIVGWTTHWHTVIPLDYVALALVVSLSIGLFFGVFPARRASLLFPIDALRTE